MILEYRGVHPRIGNNVFIAPTAVVIGDVEIRDNASIWYGTVVRGDRDTITIGENSNIQDNCTVHTDPGKPVFIGSGVSVGHGAVVHGCTIENDCLIGIKAAVLNGALVRQGSIVGSGAVVREGQAVGPFQLVAGVPAEPKKRLDETVVEEIRGTSRIYLTLAAEHARNPVTNGCPPAGSPTGHSG
jgi:carbonic anhydrase/acetyltransferase-like protein (isoleucine patch superfamily)